MLQSPCWRINWLHPHAALLHLLWLTVRGLAKPQEFAVHAGLGQGVRLTRREWGAVRAALGKTRRLSLGFLRQERAKLESYRNIVRAKYEEVLG